MTWREYFSVPAMRGFSSYRSGGVLVHFAFDVALAVIAIELVHRWAASSLWLDMAVALAAVAAVWGVGVFLGYFAPWGFFICAGTVALAWFLTRESEAVWPSVFMAYGAHILLVFVLPKEK